MPLAGLLGVDVGFIRKSKRRNDYDVKIVGEQDLIIRRRTYKSRVVCVEDYVCTGNSLRAIMEKAMEYGAFYVQGASVRNSRQGHYLKEEKNKKGFHLYTLE